MCNLTTFALRHTQILLSGILRYFRPPSRHLLLHTHDTNMEFLQLSPPARYFLFFSKTKIFHSHPCLLHISLYFIQCQCGCGGPHNIATCQGGTCTPLSHLSPLHTVPVWVWWATQHCHLSGWNMYPFVTSLSTSYSASVGVVGHTTLPPVRVEHVPLCHISLHFIQCQCGCGGPHNIATCQGGTCTPLSHLSLLHTVPVWVWWATQHCHLSGWNMYPFVTSLSTSYSASVGVVGHTTLPPVRVEHVPLCHISLHFIQCQCGCGGPYNIVSSLGCNMCPHLTPVFTCLTWRQCMLQVT